MEQLTLAPELADIESAAAWARDAAARLAVPSAAVFALDLCLEEALSNTINYGFAAPPPADARLCLVLVRESDALRVTIEDNAAPFDPCAADDAVLPTDVATAKRGGLGIHLMRHFTKSMAYERIDDRNRLTLWFATDAGSDEKAEARKGT